MQAVKDAVRAHYSNVANRGEPCCGPDAAESCCGPSAGRLGYDEAELAAVPREADLGQGCGNPSAIADLKPGETVIDLGSGAGLDCFLVAERVGPAGRVIGVDMTPDMISRARRLAEERNSSNIEFRLGEIEHLPVPDGIADVMISNCVINLSPDKTAVFSEAYRVLKPGGRLAIFDMVATAPVPQAIRDDVASYVRCIAGAATVKELEATLSSAGFTNIRIREQGPGRPLNTEGPGADVAVTSASIEAVKP